MILIGTFIVSGIRFFLSQVLRLKDYRKSRQSVCGKTIYYKYFWCYNWLTDSNVIIRLQARFTNSEEVYILAVATVSRSEILGIEGTPVCGLTSFRFGKYSKPVRGHATSCLHDQKHQKSTLMDLISWYLLLITSQAPNKGRQILAH